MARLKLDAPKGDGSKPGEPRDKSADAVKARRWKRELQIAGKREKEYRKNGEKIIKRYDGEEKKRNRYNILWSNTDVMSPAIFNSAPEPDVRRRFRDSDPLGRAVGQVLERSLSVMCDGDMTVDSLKADVLDALLPGRGVSRIRYVPVLNDDAEDLDPEKREEDRDDDGDPGAPAVDSSLPSEPGEGSYTEVEFEQIILEHVDWRDFRHGFGRVWPEVPWVGFRHKLSRRDWIKKFGRTRIDELKFAVPTDEEGKRDPEHDQETAKLAECWEIWDKDGTEVFFITEQIDQCFYPLDNEDGEPPLQLEGFFPCPKPLMLIERVGSLVPTPLFHMYEEQANELDKLSLRIDKIVAALKVRGIYDSTMKELKDLLSSDDNDLTPVQNAQKYIAAGGLEKAITWMPIEAAVAALSALYDARERQLKIIDQLLGISDIVRGVTDPDETLGAQQMKGGYFSIRLWRYQQEVKRYGRDLLRLAASAMAQMFSAETFEAMTDLHFPDAATKAAAQFQLSRPAMPPQPLALPAPAGAQGPPPGQPPMPGGPPPPGSPQPPPMPQPGQPPMAPHPGGPMTAPPQTGPDPKLLAILRMPTWDDILGLMRSPSMRQFRTDVESDSMIAGTIQSDMSALSQVLEAIIKFLEGIAPIVQSGSLPIDSAKELVLAIIRRAKLGTAVEDAFEKMTAPKPPQQPQDAQIQKAQIDAQSREKIAALEQQSKEKMQQLDLQHQQALEGIKAQAAAAAAHADHQREMARGGADSQNQAAQAQADKAHEQQLETIKQNAETQRRAAELAQQQSQAELDARTKIEVANIQAAASLKQQSLQQAHEADMAAQAASAELGQRQADDQRRQQDDAKRAQDSGAQTDHVKALTEHVGRLVESLGKPRTVVRDGTGKMIGVQ